MRRIVKNSFIQKVLQEWGSDIPHHRKKDRKKSKLVRSRLKVNTLKEIQQYEK